jgi:two-component sensor histidine kinase
VINWLGIKAKCLKDELYLVLLAIFFSCIFSNNSFCQSGQEAWLDKLTGEIKKSRQYDSEKINRIDSLYRLYDKKPANALFDQYRKLYEEYAVFNFDSAYFYAKKMQKLGYEFKNASLISYANIKLGFVLLSSGMFKEMQEILYQLDTTRLDNFERPEYYILKSRSLFDLADYNHDNVYSPAYTAEAERFLDSILIKFPSNSFEFRYYSGLKSIRSGEIWKASAFFQNLSDDRSLSLHQQAIVYSTFSDIYIRRQMVDSAIILLSKASIADIQSSTRETAAILNLATLLFKQGNLKRASLFIQKAADDAKLYGARQRILQLSTVMPGIEAQRLALTEQSRAKVTRYAIAITGLLLLVLVMGGIVIKQVTKLKKQQKEINDQNISLQHMLEEKEWLIKEIHHRVKNNLHTIFSLLESQSLYLKNEALDAIRDTQHRVFAMSLVHQKLYLPEVNLTKINMSGYLYELVNYLCDSFETGRRIQFKMDLDPIELDISLAVPMGIILNEAITNSVKYAFPANGTGIISISIKKSQRQLLFTVADNGVGLPPNFSIENAKTLGMKLMKGLSFDIKASFQVENKDGTFILITFDEDTASTGTLSRVET